MGASAVCFSGCVMIRGQRLRGGRLQQLPPITHSHCRLLAEPLLARSAVVDVLQHVTQHGSLPALVLAHSFDALVHPGT